VVAVAYPLVFLPVGDVFIIIIQCVAALGTYLIASVLTGNESYAYIKDIIYGVLKKKN